MEGKPPPNKSGIAFNNSPSVWPIQTRVLGGDSWLPALFSKGAVDHVSNLAVIQYTNAFTPCHLLERPAPTGSMETSTAVTIEDNATRVGKCLLAGLEPPCLDATGGCVTGADTPQHRIENKHRWKALLATQLSKTQWTMYQGEFDLPTPLASLATHRGKMCPSRLALHHPAADLFKEWSTYGCPTCTGKP
jgi:hypothetical protein